MKKFTLESDTFKVPVAMESSNYLAMREEITELERRLERARVKIAKTEADRDHWQGMHSSQDATIADLENRLQTCTEARLAETIRDLPKIKALTDAMENYLQGFESTSVYWEINARSDLFQAYKDYKEEEK